MKLPIKATNFLITPGIKEYLVKKLAGVERLLKGAGSAISGWIEVGKTTKHHKKGEVWRAEAQVRLSGRDIRSEGTASSIFEAINQMRDKLWRELGKYKDRALARRRDKRI